MSRLTDLIARAKAKDPALGDELESEFRVLASRRAFGLNFERHRPESVELPGRPIRRGDKVRVLPPRGSLVKGDQRLWRVRHVSDEGSRRTAHVSLIDASESEMAHVAVDDLVVVAEFRDYIYPGLVSTGKIERGGDKPFHTVINAENFHALEALTFTHRGKIDAIYIDPPYNTGARDWKYNNDYVEGEDLYRHSKWLAMMERRLRVAKSLLNQADSLLIVTIDEKEYLRLGLLIEQLFPEARVQMVSVSINPAAVARSGYFGRSDEYYFFVMLGACGVRAIRLSEEWITTKGRTHKGDIRWDLLRKSGSSPTREGHPETFYPFFIRADGKSFHSVGEPIGVGANRRETVSPEGTIAVWPIRKNGTEGRWRLKPSTVREVLAAGGLRIGDLKGETTPIYYLAEGERAKIDKGTYEVLGRRDDGSIITSTLETTERVTVPGTQWRIGSHDATQYGTRLLLKMLPDRKFPFPKSLFANAAKRWHEDGDRHAFSLTATTGAGKTVMAAAVFEALFHGDDSFDYDADPGAVVIWFSDDPSLNAQSHFRLREASDKLTLSDLEIVQNTFNREKFEAGKVYFLNTQKLSKSSILVRGHEPDDTDLESVGGQIVMPDMRAHTIWDTIRNTIEDPDLTLYLVLDEAHRGMKGAAGGNGSGGEKTTIVKRLINGSGSVPAIPIVLRISATVKRFNDAMADMKHRATLPNVIVPTDKVQESGLLKDTIALDVPKEAGQFDTVLVRRGTDKLKEISAAWEEYAKAQNDADNVLPLMVLQVPNTPDHNDIGTALDTICDRWPALPPDSVAHVFGDHMDQTFGSHTVPYISPERVQEETWVRVLIAKDAISTGWDCPRAEVMVSFRPARDRTHITQLLGRMVRTPLARRIPGNDRLNAVDCLLSSTQRQSGKSQKS